MTPQDRFPAFLAKYTGATGVGNTPQNKGECVGLVMVWAQALGLPHVWGHAKDLLVNADRAAYDVIPNTPSAVPQAGDIIVWRQGFNGTYGHTAISTGKATTATFEVFEQNNPLGAGCRVATYRNYAYVDGWLRAKTATPAPTPTPQPAPITPDTVYDLGTGNADVRGFVTVRAILDAFRRVRELTDDLHKATTRIGELEDTNRYLTQQVQGLIKTLAEKPKTPLISPAPTSSQPNTSSSWSTWLLKLLGR